MNNAANLPAREVPTPIVQEMILESLRCYARKLFHQGHPKEMIRLQLTVMATAQGIMHWAKYAIPEIADVGESKWDVPFIDSTTFAETEYPQNYWIADVLAEGQPHINGGASKTLKTTIGVLEAGISIASGEKYLGVFEVNRTGRVGIISGESGPATLKRNALTICKAKGVKLADLPVFWCFDMPQLSDPEAILNIKRFVRTERIEVLFVDPLYLALLDSESAGQAGNVFAMGAKLRELSAFAMETGVTLSLAHHCRKANKFDPNRFDPPELESMSMAGFAEWARQWQLFGRRDAYKQGSGEHRLWLNVGGSAGHSGLYAIDIFEGVPGVPHWDVKVRSADDVIDEEAAQRAEKKESRAASKKNEQRAKLVDRILEAAEALGDFASRRQIRMKAGISDRTAPNELFDDLVEDGELESVAAEGRPGPKNTPLFRRLRHCDKDCDSRSVAV